MELDFTRMVLLLVISLTKKNNYREPFFESSKVRKRIPSSVKHPKKYKSNLRPWYTKATTEKKQTWSDVYLGFNSKFRCITNSYPIYNKNENIKGVLGVDLYFDDFDVRPVCSKLVIA